MGRPLVCDYIEGNVVVSGSRVQAWYSVPTVRWHWQTTALREEAHTQLALRMAQLMDRRLLFRNSEVPLDIDAETDSLYRLPYGAGPDWTDLVAEVMANVAEAALVDKRCYVGVELSRPVWWRLGQALSRRPGRAQDRDLAEVGRIVGGVGLEAVPLSDDELDWLVRRSLAPGCPAPPGRTSLLGGRRSRDDLQELTEPVQMWSRPYRRAAQVLADYGYEQHEAWVSTLVLGRFRPLPVSDPMLARADSLGFPVESLAALEPIRKAGYLNRLGRSLRKIRSQEKHIGEEHGLDVPTDLADQRDLGLRAQHDMEHGGPQHLRAEGWVRWSVSGPDEATAVDRSQKLRELHEPDHLERPADQWRLARSLVPGEALGPTSFQRTNKLETWANIVMPTVPEVGHPDGFPMGHTVSGKRRLFRLNPWRPMEVLERSGAWLVVGGLGSGKSTFAGMLSCYSKEAGVPVRLFDPPGLLGQSLCSLWPDSVFLNLLDAEPGTLNTYGLIPDPLPINFTSPARYGDAVKSVEKQRRTQTTDAFFGLLPSVYWNLDTYKVIKRAVRSCPADVTTSPWRPIEALLAEGGHARDVGEELADVADLPGARLIFPSSREVGSGRHATAAPLVAISMLGLELPDESAAREEWTTEHLLSMAVLGLASSYTLRSIYTGSRHARKLTIFDEVSLLSQTVLGRRLYRRIVVDSRKYNNSAWLLSQDRAEIPGIGNKIHGSVVLRTEDAEAQREAAAVQRIPAGSGYEAEYGSLSAQRRGASGRSGKREAIVNDGEGGIERVRVRLDWLPERMQSALDSTAAPVADEESVNPALAASV